MVDTMGSNQKQATLGAVIVVGFTLARRLLRGLPGERPCVPTAIG